MKTLARRLRKHQICFSTVKSTTLLQSSKTFSSNKPEWKSKTNVIITNPVLLLMESCTSMIQLKQIQAHMTRTGLITHTFPLSRVLAFCALSDSGDISHADILFTLIENPNTYMWNTMIRGYSRARMPAVGLSFFFRMVHESVEMDSRSFVFVLKVCGQLFRDFEGKFIHCRIWKMGFDSDTLVQNGLIHFYGVIGSLSSARQLFEEMTCRDVFSWTSMIDAYTTHNWVNEALELFKLMLMSDVEPNEVTMVSVIAACSQKGSLELGKSIHEYIKMKKVTCSINLMNAISDMYVKCGCLSAARENFNNLKVKDVFSWTTMVNGYAKFGELDNARTLFDEMPERNGVSWNAMIAGYSQNNQPKEAIGLFHEMVEAGLVPMESTLVCVLSACGQLGYSELGQWIYHYYMGHRRIKPSVIITNAFIDMYAKCGKIGAAAKIFSEMSQRNLVSWNSMIAGFASHGHSKEAIVVFKEMISAGVKPDDITFVGVLSACTHGGLVTEGRDYFQNMERNFGLFPKGEHYACFIDLLGRTGFLEEAYELIMKMPMEPSEAAWGALLNACSMHGNVELAKVAATKLLSLNPEDSGVYVLLANICAHGRRWGDVRMVRSMMREMGVKKTPGCSLIEVDGEVHEFFVADKSHPLYKEIHEVLSEITLLSKLEETMYLSFDEF